VALNADGTIGVVVDDAGEHEAMVAAVYNVCDADPPPFESCFLLTLGAGNTWTGNVPAGLLDSFDILEHHKQIVAYGFKAGQVSAPIEHLFRINRPHPGLSCATTAAQRRCANCSPTQPLTVCLQLTHAGGINNDAEDHCNNCARLNDPVLLQHSNDPCLGCCWFSAPVDFCSNDPGPGYWRLQKIDARNWNLKLYIAKTNAAPAEVILYSAATAADNVCSFPITLNRHDPQTDPTACDGWPAQITISAAP